MRAAALVAAFAMLCGSTACTVADNNPATGGAAGVGAAGTGATGGIAGSGGSAGSAGAPSFGATTCLGILECIVACPDNDDPCLDACLSKGSADAQNKLVSLANCVSTNNCSEVECMGQFCATQLDACINGTAAGGGQPNPGGGVPTGSVPPELVGKWAIAYSNEHIEFVFNADGSASHAKYKETTIGTCSIAADASWPTGSATVSGDALTVTLAGGATNVAYTPLSCGSAYTNPADAKILNYKWQIDSTSSPPWLELTESPCDKPVDYCRTLLKKQ